LFRKSLIIVAFIVVFGCADDSKEQLFDKGVKFLAENNPRGAIVFLKNALEKDQNFFEARLELAKAYYRAGDMKSAEKEFEKVKRQNPSLKEARLGLARVYLMTSRHQEALSEVASLAGADSTHAEALELAGLARSGEGDYETAVQLLGRAISIDSAKPELRISLAKVYLSSGSQDEAEKEVREALRIDPAERAGLYMLAAIQEKRGLPDEALGTYDRIYELHPEEFQARYMKGLLLIKEGRHDEALPVAEEIARNLPKSPAGYRLKGLALFFKKNFTDSLTYFQKSIALEPSKNDYYYLGLCYYYLGEMEQSISQLYRALDQDPAMVRARLLVSLVLLGQKRYDDAVTEVKRVLETDQKNSLAYNILGSAYMAKGMFDEGMAAFDRAIELDPDFVDAHLNKGLFSLSRGRKAEAEAELASAVSAAPEVLNTRIILASYYLRQGETAKAVDVLKEGLAGQDKDAIIHNLIAEALLAENKTDEALQHLEMAKAANPKDTSASFNLASLYLFRSEGEKALKELYSVLEKSPGDAKVALAIATIHETTGMSDKALEYYTKAAETGSSEGYAGLALFHARNGDFKKALAVLKMATERDKSDAVLYVLEGKLLLSQKKLKEAVRSFEEAEKAKPGQGLPHVLSAYVQMQKPAEALGRLKEELKKDPRRADLMAEVSRLYLVMGDAQRARSAANDIISMSPGSPIGYIAMANVHLRDKETEKAIKILKDAPVARDRQADIHTMLGDIQASKKDYRSAIEAYRTAEIIDAGNVNAVYRLGVMLQAAGRTEESVARYRRVLRLSSGRHMAAMNNLAYIYAERGTNLFEALRLASRAYSMSPGDGAVLDTLGYVLLKSGRNKEALSVLEKASRALEGNATVHYHLSLAYIQNESRAKAVESLRRALGLGEFPEAAEARRLLSDLTGGKG